MLLKPGMAVSTGGLFPLMLRFQGTVYGTGYCPVKTSPSLASDIKILLKFDLPKKTPASKIVLTTGFGSALASAEFWLVMLYMVAYSHHSQQRSK